MKVQNAVVGAEVQVKRDCRGHSDEFIKEGLVCTVDKVMGDGYELRLLNPDIDMGFAWVNASDVRRYTKPTEPLTKGTKVQVKSTLVGKWGERLQEGDVYILQGDEDVSYDGTCRRIDVRAVASSSSWCTQPKYFDVLPDEVPDELTQEDVRIGDWVVCSVSVSQLTVGVAYRVIGYTSWGSLLISNPHKDYEHWADGYAVVPKYFNKVLREVNDATPRS